MFGIMIDGDIVYESQHLELCLCVLSLWESYNLNVRLCVGDTKNA